jgi:hypothetical protein
MFWKAYRNTLQSSSGNKQSNAKKKKEFLAYHNFKAGLNCDETFHFSLTAFWKFGLKTEKVTFPNLYFKMKASVVFGNFH